MFEALLLICMVNNPGHCMTGHDERGPYDTMSQCQDRIAEMTAGILTHPKTKDTIFVAGARCDITSGAKI